MSSSNHLPGELVSNSRDWTGNLTSTSSSKDDVQQTPTSIHPMIERWESEDDQLKKTATLEDYNDLPTPESGTTVGYPLPESQENRGSSPLCHSVWTKQCTGVLNHTAGTDKITHHSPGLLSRKQITSCNDTHLFFFFKVNYLLHTQYISILYI